MFTVKELYQAAVHCSDPRYTVHEKFVPLMNPVADELQAGVENLIPESTDEWGLVLCALLECCSSGYSEGFKDCIRFMIDCCGIISSGGEKDVCNSL